MTDSNPERDPRGWVSTSAHLVYLPADEVDLAHAGDDAKDVTFSRCRLQKSQCLLEGKVLTASVLPLTTIKSFKNRSSDSGRLDWNQPSSICWGGAFHRLWNRIGQFDQSGRPIVSNNFLVKFGEFILWKEGVNST